MFSTLLAQVQNCISVSFSWVSSIYAVLGLSFFAIFSVMIVSRFMVRNFVSPFL